MSHMAEVANVNAIMPKAEKSVKKGICALHPSSLKCCPRKADFFQRARHGETGGESITAIVEMAFTLQRVHLRKVRFPAHALKSVEARYFRPGNS